MSVSDRFDPTKGVRIVDHGDVAVVERGSPNLVSKAKAYAAEHGVPIETAMVAVARTDPSLMD